MPGTQFEDYRPFGAGKLVPAGTDIQFRLHYTTTGKEVLNRPRLGFTVAKEPPKRQYASSSIRRRTRPFSPFRRTTPIGRLQFRKQRSWKTWIWFGRQLGYRFKPMHLPKGTKLTVTAHYDNSPNNRANPDPNRTVYWGDQAWEEMMSPFFAVIAGRNVDAKKILKTPNSVRPGA